MLVGLKEHGKGKESLWGKGIEGMTEGVSE